MQSQEARLSDSRNEFAWKCARFEMFANDWQHALLHKLAYGIAHHALFFAKKTVDIIKISRRRHLHLAFNSRICHKNICSVSLLHCSNSLHLPGDALSPLSS